MYRPSHDRGPETWGEIWFSVGFLLLFLGLVAGAIISDFQPIKLAPVFVILFWFVLLVTHEAGHAIMGRLVGWRLGRMVLGMGRKLGAFRIGSLPVEVRLFPIEGFVEGVPANLRWVRLKSALFYFAGPGMDLLLGLPVLFWVGPDQFLVRSDNYGHILWQSFVLAALSQAAFNLFPHAVFSDGGILPSDGLGILRSFWVPIEHYAAMAQMRFDPDEERWSEAPTDEDRMR